MFIFNCFPELKLIFSRRKKNKEPTPNHKLRTNLNIDSFIEYKHTIHHDLDLNVDELSDTYIYGKNLQYVFVRSNKLDLLGGSEDTLIGNFAKDVLPVNIYEVLNGLYKIVDKNRSHLQRVYFWLGSYQILDVFPLENNKGKFIGLIVFQREVDNVNKLLIK